MKVGARVRSTVGGRARRGAATEDGSGRLEAEVGVAGRSVIPAYPLGRGLPRRPGIVRFSWDPPNSGPGAPRDALGRPRIKKYVKFCIFMNLANFHEMNKN